MDQITLTFQRPINVSVQKGDIIYYTDDPEGDIIVKVGEAITVTRYTITCYIEEKTLRPTTESFILFSKDNKTNMTSLTGYFMNVTMKNDSDEYAEIFSVGTEVFESSK